ncbi:DUF4199 domain-containing protein [Flavobacterium sp.]|uniref:DUF4199 domain-containing protein n=1 Tax=Flavobacterium sp. TaxID=239 RepID=UPI00286D9BD9|nr:DUF4199 domain-containing protein [Flavobacterium sp.]
MNEIIKRNGINYGIITGVVSLLITTLIYVIDLKFFTSWWIGLLSIAFYIVLGCILLSKTKKELKGIFSFKEAFTTYFISAVIGILISVVFNIILFNYIDPDAKETIKELTMKYTVEMLQKFGTPASEINKAVADLEATDQFSISKLLQGSIFSILFSCIFGLILAAIFKSKPSYQ